MEKTITIPLPPMAEHNQRISNTVEREQKRLFRFIRERVPQEADAEDILQDVFYQFVNTSITEPIEQAASWLFKVATNRITDWYRKKKTVPFSAFAPTEGEEDDDEKMGPEYKLFDPDADPDTLYMRSLIWEELEAALEELPKAQRDVFVMHELEDKSFKDIAGLTGETVNTLLSRKRYAIIFLRKRMQELYSDLLSY
jgi:RNA polymerase sigma factor (sigma-70 family)